MSNRNIDPVGWWSLAAGLSVAALWLAPSRAQACGMGPLSVYTITSVSPAGGALGVARNTGIIITGSAEPLNDGSAHFANVRLFDVDTGGAVPLRGSSWFSLGASAPVMAVHPADPLEPSRAYRVEATTAEPNTRDPSTLVVSEFITSERLLEPVVLSGELGLTLRGGEADILEHGFCGPSTPVGKRRALYADVRLPVPSGGQGIYRGALQFADNTPPRPVPLDPLGYDPSESHELRDVQAIELDAGEALSVSQELIATESAYAGCFTLVVWDPAGNTAQTSACLPVLAPDTIRTLALDDASVELAAHEESAAEQVESALVERRERGPVWSCAVATHQPLPLPGWLALLASAYLGRRLAAVRAKRSSEPEPQR